MRTVLAAAALLLLSSVAAVAQSGAPKDALAPADALSGKAACFIVHDLSTGKPLTAVGGARCAKRLPPCQTFDIPLALLALDGGLLFDERTTRRRARAAAPDEPRDATLGDAFSRPLDWFFDELAEKLKPDDVRAFLQKSAYGDAAFASGVFWRGSPGSLTISTEEQIAVLTKLYRGQLPASVYAMDVVRGLLVIARTAEVAVSARGGTCAGATWIVGEVAKEGKAYVYALGAEGTLVEGEAPRELALRLLAGAGVL